MLRTFVIGTFMCFTAPLVVAQNIAGDWEGALNAGTSQLHVVLHIARGTDGALAATLDSVDQGANGIPVTAIVFENAKLSLRLDSIHGTYEGKLSSDGMEIDGTWSQGSPMELNFKHAAPPSKSR